MPEPVAVYKYSKRPFLERGIGYDLSVKFLIGKIAPSADYLTEENAQNDTVSDYGIRRLFVPVHAEK